MNNLIVKLSEKPIISMNTGKTLGALKGLVYKSNIVTFLYCKFTNKYVYIPVKNAYIGQDAIMVEWVEDMDMFQTDKATKVYNTNGKEVGTATSIEMDDSFNITGIIVDHLFIEIDKILHMEDIIIVEIDKLEKKHTVPTSVNQITPIEIDSTPTQEEEQTNIINNELNLKTNSTSIQQINENPIEDEIITVDIEDNLTIEIDSRYNYLMGKKLLEDIEIAKETYKKDTLIDAALIEFAICNNGIVKVIMNTED